MTTASPITSLNPRRNTRPEQDEQAHGDDQPLAVLGGLVGVGQRPERVADQVLGGVGGRQGLGDDEVGGREPEQDQHQDLARPPA